jgi:flagellar hook-basal body complex protein FliE
MNVPGVRLPLTPPGVSGIQPGVKPAGQTDNTSQISFDKMLQGLSEQQNTSDGLLKKLSAGENVDLHNVMIATEQTDLNFRVAMAIRDRLVESYREVMRMNV